MEAAHEVSSQKITQKLKQFFTQSSQDYAIFYALVVLFIIMSIIADTFFSVENISNIVRQTAIVGIMAAGEFFVITAGMIDLSVGSTLAMSGIVFAAILKSGGIEMMLVAILAGIGVGLLIGLINGIITSCFHIPPFITTLGTMLIVRGVVQASTNSYPIAGLPDGVEYLGRGFLFGIPVPVYIMIAVFIIAKIIAEKKKSGRFMYAIGGNEEAAYLSGIKVNKYKILAYVICGIMAGISGIIMVSRLTSGQPKAGVGYEFEAIIAVIIGGVSFAGGKGKVLSVLIGALFVSTLITGLRIMNVDTNFQDITKGVVFILAIGIDVLRNRSKK